MSRVNSLSLSDKSVQITEVLFRRYNFSWEHFYKKNFLDPAPIYTSYKCRNQRVKFGQYLLENRLGVDKPKEKSIMKGGEKDD
jgi:hypothetical protein